MAPSILKFAAAATSLRSIVRSPNSCRAAWMINKSDESRNSFLSSSYPWLMLSPQFWNKSYELYSFAENKLLSIPKPEIESEFRYARIIGSSHGWLAYYNYLGVGGELFLSNPISGHRINLPPIHNVSATESERNTESECRKMRMTCSDPESEDCRVVMKFGTADELALCCPGRSSSFVWKNFGSEQGKAYHDFLYCSKHELLFSLCFSNSRQLEAWDLRNPSSPSLVWSCNFNDLELDDCDNGGEPPSCKQEIQEFSDRQEYLVTSQQGDLFYVKRYINRCMLPYGSCAPIETDSEYRYPAKTIGFDVYKIVRDGDKGKKVLMDGHLDGLVMFVGDPSDGMAIPANDAIGFKPNSICFTNDHFSSRHGSDNGIFDYKDKELYSCYYPSDYSSMRYYISPPPLWFSPN